MWKPKKCSSGAARCTVQLLKVFAKMRLCFWIVCSYFSIRSKYEADIASEHLTIVSAAIKGVMSREFLGSVSIAHEIHMDCMFPYLSYFAQSLFVSITLLQIVGLSGMTLWKRCMWMIWLKRTVILRHTSIQAA